jgi:hypothetical protein
MNAELGIIYLMKHKETSTNVKELTEKGGRIIACSRRYRYIIRQDGWCSYQVQRTTVYVGTEHEYRRLTCCIEREREREREERATGPKRNASPDVRRCNVRKHNAIASHKYHVLALISHFVNINFIIIFCIMPRSRCSLF